ncbi:MAG: type II toxin-antitoxin system prevent-host-death family antitoxin [Thiobacillus sp.]|mgnify:FL=1|nr:type II toxin-antitoxin system prevent-host-death family antitoxin [Thiobacillus sp.]MDP2252603.1 type II toxin-antitoxin system prevent-host-death family antitoxin [Thiobacillus sp.]MDP2978155.1 type II toxin-antitoxin system prevent-host-death family antitoxin [Thiobacillus sp.]MDZ7584871.1 type II toxin-antitoxin system prevent-host-death family antitoxin [Thiobacillus sp.]
MLTVNIHDAKTQLSKLVDQAARGEAFIIAKAGKPMVKVIPLGEAEAGTASRLGFMAGEFSVPDDFDQMGSSEIESLFTGRKA